MDGKAFLIGCVVGGAVGGLGAMVFAPDPAPAARAPGRSPSLERRLDALSADVARVAESVEALDRTAVASTPPAPAGDATKRPLARPRMAPDPELAQLAKEPTKADALERIGSEHAGNLAKKGTWYAASKHLTDQHLFRTYKEILRAFGKPASVRPYDAGVVFSYPLPVPGTRNQFYVTFTFVDGMVMRVDAACGAFQEGR